MIAVVLKLGNLTFLPTTNIDGTEGCEISNEYEIQEIAQLLQIEGQTLINCLTRIGENWCQTDNGSSEIEAAQGNIKNLTSKFKNLNYIIFLYFSALYQTIPLSDDIRPPICLHCEPDKRVLKKEAFGAREKYRDIRFLRFRIAGNKFI